MNIDTAPMWPPVGSVLTVKSASGVERGSFVVRSVSADGTIEAHMLPAGTIAGDTLSYFRFEDFHGLQRH